MKLTKARPGDVLERRGEHGEVVVVAVVNVFTASDPGGAGNKRCADYRASFSPSLADKLARSTATHTATEIAAEMASVVQNRVMV